MSAMRRRLREPTRTLSRKRRTESAQGLKASRPPRTMARTGREIVLASTGPANGSTTDVPAPAGVGEGVGVAEAAGVADVDGLGSGATRASGGATRPARRLQPG